MKSRPKLAARRCNALGLGAALLLGAANASAARTVYLFFADGVTPIAAGRSCNGHKLPPAYNCSFGGLRGVAGCQQEIQGFLDRFYADFDVEFTTTAPPAGPFYTIVVTASWPECAQSSKENGVAQLSCNDYNGNVGYVFNCGDSAKVCATTIAHEHGHLVGLEHTNTDGDVMWPHECKSCDGFLDRSTPIDGKSQCARSSQNSYQMMLSRLSAAPAGEKGGARCMDDAAPELVIVSPEATGTVVGRSVRVSALAADECGVRSIEFMIGKESRRIYSAPFEADIPIPKAAQVTLTATAEDNSGKRASASLTFHQDLSQRPPDPKPDEDDDLFGCLCRVHPGAGRIPSTVGALALALGVLWSLRRNLGNSSKERE